MVGEILNLAWYEKYRSNSLESYIFENEQQKKLITRWYENEYIDGNVLLYGSAGLGKTTIAQILVKRIIKTNADLKYVVSRSVSSIDDEIIPFLPNSPMKSKQKIVFFEEFDKISSQAKNQLKTDIMEKYIPKTIFIATTNDPRAIPYPLMTRFTFRFQFLGKNLNEIYKRLLFILKNENAKFDQDSLKEYVEKYHSKGTRELINILQNQYLSNDGNIEFDQLLSTDSNQNIEDNIVALIKTMVEYSFKCELSERKKIIFDPYKSGIASEYQTFFKTIHNNYDVNYNTIYEKCLEVFHFVPIQQIVGKYHETSDYKKYQHLHLLGMLIEIFKCASEFTL